MEQNFAAIAGYYSQLAGVLAGFAFASLIALLLAPLAPDVKAPTSMGAILPLGSALVGLIGTSLNYAITAGETGRSVRAATLETAAGLGFSVAGLMLFCSLLVLVSAVANDVSEDHQAAAQAGKQFLQRAIAFLVAPILPLLMFGGTSDFLHLKYPSRWDRTPLYWFTVGTVVLTWLSILAIWAHAHVRPTRPQTASPNLAGVAVALSGLAVAATTVIIIYVPEGANVWDAIPAAASLIVYAFVTRVVYWAVQLP